MTRAQHRLPWCRTWILLVVVGLLVGHVAVLYYVSSRVALSALLSAALVVLVIKHRALPGRMHTLFRRRLPNAREMDREYREG
jgi:Flp pilus assembly protein TadB